ncbi:MAG: HU family DNA-binding protein [Bacteroidales bacterium]|nr:HU family DNA-binding protein [Bacteroidales bacterium]
MALIEYIKDQLLFNESLTLPGLGSFEIRKKSSRIKGNKISPPSATVFFNQENSLDDGKLAKALANAEEISQDEAAQKVLEFIDEILFALNKGEKFPLEGFGTLFRDEENVLRFEKDPSFNVGVESFGLESFEIDPIEESTEDIAPVEEFTKKEELHASAEVKEEKPSKIKHESGAIIPPPQIDPPSPKELKSSRSLFWILTGAIIVILISFVLVKMTTNLLDGPGMSIFSHGQDDKTGLFPEDENWDLESSLNSDLGDAIDSMTMQENALSIKETKAPEEKIVVLEPKTVNPSEYKEFHIIAGSFKDKVNAGILQQELTEKGYPAVVIQQGDKLYRVSAMSFSDKNAGLQELQKFKQKTKNNAAWLLSLKNE